MVKRKEGKRESAIRSGKATASAQAIEEAAGCMIPLARMIDDRRMMYGQITERLLQCDQSEIVTIREVLVGFDPVIKECEDHRKEEIGEIVCRLGPATFHQVSLVYSLLSAMHRIPALPLEFKRGRANGHRQPSRSA